MHFSHGRLYVERPHVLPILLQEGHEEINCQHNVRVQLVRFHGDVTDGYGQTQDLFHLELDGSLDGLHLFLHGLLVGECGGELASFVQTGSWRGMLPVSRVRAFTIDIFKLMY